MEDRLCRVTVGEKTFFYPAGTPYGRIAEDFPGQQDCPALLVASNGRLRELHKPLREDCTLEYITIKDEIGYMAYRRSVTLLMLAAVRRVAGADGARVVLHFSADSGYYCTLKGKKKPDQEFLDAVKGETGNASKASEPASTSKQTPGQKHSVKRARK